MPRPRGRPPKYGRPTKIVAVTLPEEVVAALSRVHEDLGWAIVTLVGEHRQRTSDASPESGTRKTRRPARELTDEAELVSIGAGQSLIVVNAATVRSLPGVQMIPFTETRSFLAFEPGKGMADLELAVHDRLERLRAGSRERRAVERLLNRLRKWRKDASLGFAQRSIILVSDVKPPAEA